LCSDVDRDLAGRYLAYVALLPMICRWITGQLEDASLVKLVAKEIRAIDLLTCLSKTYDSPAAKMANASHN